MSVNNLYYLGGILLPNGTLISQLNSAAPASNTDGITGYAAGYPYPLFRGIRAQQPDVPFSSPAVGSILTPILAGGNPYALGLSTGATDLFYRQGQNLGFRYADAQSQHERLRMTRGFLFWQTIAATHRQDAEISCRLIAAYDGTNAAIQNVGTGTLSGTPSATEFYTLGPVKLNGSWLGGEQSISLASGLQPEQVGAAGETADSFVGGKMTDDVATITFIGKPWGGYGLAGSSVSSIIMYLRRKTQDGYNVADAVASHIKITAAYGQILPESASGGGNDPATSTLRLALRAADGASTAISISVGVAIV
jgi:hypothetical protein